MSRSLEATDAEDILNLFRLGRDVERISRELDLDLEVVLGVLEASDEWPTRMDPWADEATRRPR